jgi:hypothetical protein
MSLFKSKGFVIGVSFVIVGSAIAFKQELDNRVIPAVTFANQKSSVFVPARIVADKLGLYLEKKNSKSVMVGDLLVEGCLSLYDGRMLLPLQAIRDLGASVDKESQPGKIMMSIGDQTHEISVGAKKIEVDQTKQRLVGTQGNLIVIDTNVSTGRPGHRTPNGSFKTGPYKSRYHYSRLYNNAPMPYSIQVNGNIFFHGYGYVPTYAASHGCIRVPLGKRNPARYLFNWADKGVETKVFGRYEYKSVSRKKSRRRR